MPIARGNRQPHSYQQIQTTAQAAHMTDEQSHIPTGPLTDLQRARIDYARADLESARAADLAQLSPAALIFLVERLRTRLDDTLDLITEITAPESQPPLGDDPPTSPT